MSENPYQAPEADEALAARGEGTLRNAVFFGAASAAVGYTTFVATSFSVSNITTELAESPWDRTAGFLCVATTAGGVTGAVFSRLFSVRRRTQSPELGGAAGTGQSLLKPALLGCVVASIGYATFVGTVISILTVETVFFSISWEQLARFLWVATAAGGLSGAILSNAKVLLRPALLGYLAAAVGHTVFIASSLSIGVIGDELTVVMPWEEMSRGLFVAATAGVVTGVILSRRFAMRSA